MLTEYLTAHTLVAAEVVGFEAGPSCNQGHCSWSAQRNIPTHGHFRLTDAQSGGKIRKRIFWVHFGEEEALKKVDQLGLTDEVRHSLTQQIKDFFHPPPPNNERNKVIVLPVKKAA